MRIGFETTGGACDSRAVGPAAVVRADRGDGAAEQPLYGSCPGMPGAGAGFPGG